MRRSIDRHALALAPLLLLMLPPFKSSALADGFSGLIVPGYSSISTTTTDETGRTTHAHTGELSQRYLLTLDRAFYPYLRANAGGLFEKLLSQGASAGARTDSSSRTTNLFANVMLGGPLLDGNAGYTRREESTKSLLTKRLSLVNETLNFFAGYRPDGLPMVTLKLSRNLLYDTKSKVQDAATNEALVNATYTSVKQLDLRYSLRYASLEDRLNKTDTTELLHAARATYNDTFIDNRASIFLSYSLTSRAVETAVAGTGGSVATQQLPVAGLSLVEAFPAQPTQDTLNPNPALIDGDTAASAGVSVGFAPSVSGDTQSRDLGAQFADATSKVNTVYVWVDRTLPTTVFSAFAWTAYESDDNATWSTVPIVGPVVFGTFQNRFEITIAPAEAKYLKVVTAPLAPAVTADPSFANVYVTEVQFLLVVPAASVRAQPALVTSVVNATARARILETQDLYYDFSLFLTRTHQPSVRTTYFWANGLAYNRKLGRRVGLNARVAREDSDEGRGHSGAFVATGSLSANPLATLSHSLVYSGQRRQSPSGRIESNALSLFNRADLYKGIGLLAGLGYTLGRNERGQRSAGRLANLSASLTPHPVLTMTAAYVYSSTALTGGKLPKGRATGDRIEGTVSLSPVPALYVSAGLSWSRRTHETTRTLASYGLNFSPFPEGNLQLHAVYTESVDPSTNGISRLFGPSLRWNIRAGTFLDAAYTLLDVDAKIGKSRSHVSTATLTVAI